MQREEDVFQSVLEIERGMRNIPLLALLFGVVFAVVFGRKPEGEQVAEAR